MRLAARTALLALLLASPGWSQDRIPAAERPDCTTGGPVIVWLLEESSATDCDATGLGSTEALCCCSNGSWAACASAGGGSGTVTSVGLAVPAEWSVSGSPVTASGTITIAEAAQAANTCYSGPVSGGAAAPSFRALVSADLPAHLILDLGDDAGDDSVALKEVATIRDDYNAVIESSADKALIDFAKIPPYQQYDPNRPPSSCDTCDEFTGGTALSFSWQNQESSTATAERDGLTLYHPTDASGIAAYYFTGPDGSATDWTVHGRLSMLVSSASNYGAIGVLATGTEASPTLLYQIVFYAADSLNRKVGLRSLTSYTAAQTVLGTDITVSYSHYAVGYFALGYVSATKVLTAYYSGDGYIFRGFASTTLAAHPTTSFSLNVSSTSATTPAYAFFHFIRVRTDANRNDVGE